jgi:hypothetical protein
MNNEADYIKAFDEAIELQWADEIKRLRAKVERLSDAGDALAELACQRPDTTTVGDWGNALVGWLEARRER